jgi:branched-chain amino acid transport system substrate-binding protein
VTTLDRRQALRLFASLGAGGMLAPVLAACTKDTAPPRHGQINIGLVVPQSGPLQKVGDEMTAGFTLYLNLHGQRLGGVATALTLIDEGAGAASGMAAVKSALQNGTLTALAGVASSAVMTAIRGTVEAARIPLIGSNGAPLSLAAGGDPTYIWITSFVAGEAGTAMARYLNVRAKQLVVYDDGSADGQTEADKFTVEFGGPAGQIVRLSQQPHIPTVTSGQLDQIRQAGADAVFVACSGQSAVRFLAAYRAAGITVPVYGPSLLTEGWALASEKSSAQSVFTASPYATNLSSEANREFVVDYANAALTNIAANTLPSMFAMAAYDAALVLDRAVSLVEGDVTPAAINAALASAGQFTSPRGTWEFNQKRTPRQRWYLRQALVDGSQLQNKAVKEIATLT